MTIELKGVRKSFGSTEVIHGVDLKVEDGEFCVFVGPSGCGKSTLLRLIAGLEDLSDGDILIDDKIVSDVEPSSRKLAMVFQSYALYPHMTVAGNMSFGLRMTGTSKAETENRVRDAARILQLEALMDRRPAQLSGGQRQRVAIGRAIVRQPRAFLFDEPLSNLDAELRVQMRVEIAKLHADLGATMIYVTHDQVEAMTLADRIVVLRQGEVAQMGRPNALYDDPDNMFVAGFIGSPKMNFLEARLVDGGDSRVLELAGQRVALRADAASRPGQPTVTAGIRPEHFDKTGPDAVRLVVTVEVVENLGGTTMVHGRLASGESVVIERRGATDLKVRDRIEAGFDPSDLRLFDGEGQRIR